MSPADVLRLAGLPAGLFDQEKILVSTEELFALYRGLAPGQPRSGHRAQAGDGAPHRAVRPDRHRGRVGAVVSGRAAAVGPLQAAHLPGGAPTSRSAGTSAGCSSDGCSRTRRSLRCWWTCASPGCWASPAEARAGSSPRGGSSCAGATGSREMYEAHFGCPAKLDARAEHDRVRQGGSRSALPHAQRGPVRDDRAAARGRAEAGARFESDRRAGQGHPEAAAGRAAAGHRGRRERAGPRAHGRCSGG